MSAESQECVSVSLARPRYLGSLGAVVIKQAQSLGLPLTEVKEILSLADRGGSPCGHVQGALEQKLREVDLRLSELRGFRWDLACLVERAKTDYANRLGARVCPIVEHAHPPREMAVGLISMRRSRRRAS